MSDEDLHAYVDGWLDGERRLAVERLMADDPETARRVDDFRLQNHLLHELFDPVLREELPEQAGELAARLKSRFAGNDNVPRWYARPWLRSAAAMVLVCAGLAGGWFGRGSLEPAAPAAPPEQAQETTPLRSFAEEAAVAHRFYTADESAQMQSDDASALDNFLSERVGHSVAGPDLSQSGYRLTGGRSLPTELGPSAQYMYANDQGKRLTLFVGPAQHTQEGSFSFAQKGDVASFYWVESGLAYALIGRMSRDELMGITKTVYASIKASPRRPSSSPASQHPPPDKKDQQPAVQPVNDTQQPKAS